VFVRVIDPPGRHHPPCGKQRGSFQVNLRASSTKGLRLFCLSVYCGGCDPPADTQTGWFLYFRIRPALARRASANVCTLYLVFKEPRTSGVLRPFFPADCAIHFIGFCSGPFWGNLSNLRRLAFPSQSLFRFLAKKLQETFPAAQCSRPRTSRKSRRSNVGEPTPSVNPYLPTCEF